MCRLEQLVTMIWCLRPNRKTRSWVKILPLSSTVAFQLAGYATWKTPARHHLSNGNVTVSCSVSTEKIGGMSSNYPHCHYIIPLTKTFDLSFNYSFVSHLVIVWKIFKCFHFKKNRTVLANGSLHFTSVQHTRNERPDEGLYQCSATRPSVGTIISRAAKLQIASLPRFELEPKDVAVRVGDTARFNCLVMVNETNKIENELWKSNIFFFTKFIFYTRKYGRLLFLYCQADRFKRLCWCVCTTLNAGLFARLAGSP